MEPQEQEQERSRKSRKRKRKSKMWRSKRLRRKSRNRRRSRKSGKRSSKGCRTRREGGVEVVPIATVHLTTFSVTRTLCSHDRVTGDSLAAGTWHNFWFYPSICYKD